MGINQVKNLVGVSPSRSGEHVNLSMLCDFLEKAVEIRSFEYFKGRLFRYNNVAGLKVWFGQLSVHKSLIQI